MKYLNRPMRNIKSLIKNHFPRLVAAYRVYGFVPIELEPTFVPALGFKFFSHNKEMQQGIFEPNESRLVLAILDRVDSFVNVGANVGYYCCMALCKGKNCIAIEPIHENLQILQRNFVANGWHKNVQIFPVAASDIDGIVEIYGGGTGASLLEGWAGQSNSRFVPALRLDGILAGISDEKLLILVDVEGHEMATLRGSMKLLAGVPEKPLWIVEISINEHWPEGTKINPHLLDTFDLFWDNGYHAYTANHEMKEVSRGALLKIIESEENNLHTHNFLFSDLSAENLKSIIN